MSIRGLVGKLARSPKPPEPTASEKGGGGFFASSHALRPGAPPHIDISSIIEEYLYENDNQPNDARAQGYFHPSSGLLIGRDEHGSVFHTPGCPRAIVFDLLCAPKSSTLIPGNVHSIFRNGHDRHRAMDRLFEEMAAKKWMGIESIETNLPVWHPILPLGGEIDMRIRFESGWSYVYDWKGINDANAKKTLFPSFKYAVQINTYMGMSGDVASYVAYENKNNQRFLRPMEKFRVDFNPEWWSGTERFCADVLTVMHKRRILPVFDEETCATCVEGCNYRQVCEKERAGKYTFNDVDCRSAAMKEWHARAVEAFNDAEVPYEEAFGGQNQGSPGGKAAPRQLAQRIQPRRRT